MTANLVNVLMGGVFHAAILFLVAALAAVIATIGALRVKTPASTPKPTLIKIVK